MDSLTTTTIPNRASRFSTVGKPRRVTDAHIARILDWSRNRMTARQLARELGISTSTLRFVLKTGGRHYKQASPF